MTSCLILGARGFLGRHLARLLAADGVRVADAGGRDLFAAGVDDLAEMMRGHDLVYHLAWSTIPATAEADPEADLRDNGGLMLRLLAAARMTGTRLVFASSGGTVYGQGDGRPFREDDPLRPIGSYGATKVAAELHARAARVGRGVDVRIARLSNPFGAGQAGSKLQGAVSRFAALALAGEPIEMWGDGTIVRDYLHVADAVAGLRAIGLADAGALGADPVFNIASGVGTDLNAIVRLLEAELGRPIEVRRHPPRAFDLPYNVLDVARARDRLGWTPQLTLEQGVRRMIADLSADPDTAFSTLD